MAEPSGTGEPAASSSSGTLHIRPARRSFLPISAGFPGHFDGISRGAGKGTVAALTYWNLGTREDFHAPSALGSKAYFALITSTL
jgi:hypothetical protein